MSKGLGAPVGSVIVGTKEFITKVDKPIGNANDLLLAFLCN